MSACAVNSDGVMVQLDGRAPAPSTLTAEDAKDPEKLARLLNDARDRIAQFERQWSPKRTYFRDLSVTSTTTTKILLHHGFGGRVNWWVARWDCTGGAGTTHEIDEDSDTDANTLVLTSGVAGTMTVCVEAAGA